LYVGSSTGSLEGSLEEKPDESDVSDAAGNIQCCGFLGVAQTLISAWCTQHIKKLIWVGLSITHSIISNLRFSNYISIIFFSYTGEAMAE